MANREGIRPIFYILLSIVVVVALLSMFATYHLGLVSVSAIVTECQRDDNSIRVVAVGNGKEYSFFSTDLKKFRRVIVGNPISISGQMIKAEGLEAIQMTDGPIVIVKNVDP